MKLELKHIAPYLAHGIYAYDEDQESKIDKIVGLFHNTIDFENWSPLNSNIDHYKLCLLPLSALTEPLEDGSIPIDTISEFDIGHVDFITSEMEHWIKRYGRERYIGLIPFMIIEYIYSIHADIYGLIDAGLAIDKRTIKL